jgi:hypothetical protein
VSIRSLRFRAAPRRARLRVCAALAATWVLVAHAASSGSPAPFSGAPPGTSLPGGWQLTTLPGVRHATRFDLVRDGGSTVLRAVAEDAAASVVYRLRLDPAARPELAWRWKIAHVVARADLGRKSGDDFAARVYVFFDYDLARLSAWDRAKLRLARALYGSDVPAAALCYVWDNRRPAGTAVWSPYTDRVRMIVVESGNRNAGRWMTETRNVARDFRDAFGEDAPAVTGVALSVDTDNTHGSTVSYFGDVEFARAARASK